MIIGLLRFFSLGLVHIFIPHLDGRTLKYFCKLFQIDGFIDEGLTCFKLPSVPYFGKYPLLTINEFISNPLISDSSAKLIPACSLPSVASFYNSLSDQLHIDRHFYDYDSALVIQSSGISNSSYNYILSSALKVFVVKHPLDWKNNSIPSSLQIKTIDLKSVPADFFIRYFSRFNQIHFGSTFTCFLLFEFLSLKLKCGKTIPKLFYHHTYGNLSVYIELNRLYPSIDFKIVTNSDGLFHKSLT
ncbi:hypothetical protein OAA55_00425 [bacterium]|nr:hypothetical protein [bacterium]